MASCRRVKWLREGVGVMLNDESTNGKGVDMVGAAVARGDGLRCGSADADGRWGETDLVRGTGQLATGMH